METAGRRRKLFDDSDDDTAEGTYPLLFTFLKAVMSPLQLPLKSSHL